ncbi:hypothetical protein BC940DRAFT_333366 [Gongronella butleri]|nr:hypothetical protein BC940DRAFT_333366 [Gongronella butleri]
MESPPYYPQHQAIYRSKSTGTMQHVPRRLSSGSACETCRRRKTKCDGGQPCVFCATNGVDCVHRPSRRKRATPPYPSQLYHAPSASSSPSLVKQISCPSLLANQAMPSLMDQLSCRTFSVVSLADHKKSIAVYNHQDRP